MRCDTQQYNQSTSFCFPLLTLKMQQQVTEHAIEKGTSVAFELTSLRRQSMLCALAMTCHSARTTEEGSFMASAIVAVVSATREGVDEDEDDD